MQRALPYSLLSFAGMGVAIALQLIPVVSIVMLFMLAPFWPVLLVNAGLIGIALEALSDRVHRSWLLVPLTIYGAYFCFAAYDRVTLSRLTDGYERDNAQVHVPFDPGRQALMFYQAESPAWYPQNYALGVVYAANAEVPDSVRSLRMVDKTVCDKVEADRSLGAAGILTFGVTDSDADGLRSSGRRFCIVQMREAPSLPQVIVRTIEAPGKQAWLPVRAVSTIIETPDGARFELKGGTAAPLSWFPRPVFGCGVFLAKAGAPCSGFFGRDDFTPIVSGTTRDHRDARVLARALGLKPVALADRTAGDVPAALEERMQAIRQQTRQRQLANLDAMIADPLMENPDWQTGVLIHDDALLAQKAPEIMAGLERATAIYGEDSYRAARSGQTLAGLVADLPHESFLALKPRILNLYGNLNNEHWLWAQDHLFARLGDLGADAVPLLTNEQARGYNSNGSAITGLCRVGRPGHVRGIPVLFAMWNQTQDGSDHHRREALFVAMRRMGFDPPPLAKDERDQRAELEETWADVSPASPPSVCSTRKEGAERRNRLSTERRKKRATGR